MTISDHKKMLKQLDAKPVKQAKFLKHNAPKERKHGKNTKRCSMCGNPRGHIAMYGLNVCRRCFRDNAKKLGFKKYS